MKLTILGTGNATVTECYNTCFVMSEGNEHFLVDGGGGNTILRQLKQVNIDWKEVKDIFVTHKHLDHITGVLWMIRMICQTMNRGQYEGEARIYAHKEVIELLHTMAKMLLSEKETRFIGERLHFIEVTDKEERNIIGHNVKFFDIHSTKAKQYGFSFFLNETEKLTCCGDEPYNVSEKDYVMGSKWLLHEAFCLYAQADVFKPYEKHHSTVKDACMLADQMNIENLILYHTEDKNIANRKALYHAEGKEFYARNLFIPDDLETFDL